MPGMSGMDFLKELSDEHPEIIIVTGHENYAINALKMSVVDYLLKPLNKEDLKAAFNRCRERLNSKKELERYRACLLYTSDAADERSSVDLGGRRIIKKKNII